MENVKLTRNQIQEKLLICTYQYIFYLSINEKQDINIIINSSFGSNESKNDPFVKQYIISMIKNYDEIINNVSKYLKEGWDFERLSFMDKACIVLGVNEIVYLSIPKPVVINVCVKLSKEYSDENSFKFINGVLERF